MDYDADTDDAIKTAAERAREAEQRLLAEPIDSPELVPKAKVVEHFAEDIDALASDLAQDADK